LGTIKRRRLMRGRTGTIAALLALSAALAIVAAASATTSRTAAPTATAGADKALITCGRTRTLGVAAPITGLAASLGQQQLKWANYFVTRYNRSPRT
jgi:ABC-type branched-subunit amino acid transport system substrate-binding protein